MYLHEISDIRSGFTARGKLEPSKLGGVPALQLRDITSSTEVLVSAVPKYDLGELHERYFVRGGEVIFRSRGESSIALAVGNSLAEPVAVILPLVIVRPDPERVLPEYLAWAINQPEAQRQLKAEAQGQTVRMISLSTLKSLKIAVPNLGHQRLIVEISALAQREQHLLQQLADRRAQFLSAILGEAAKAAYQKELA